MASRQAIARMELDGRRVVVVGGSRGLGLGMAEALAARGADLTVVARGEAGLAALAGRVRAHTVAADATDAGAARRILRHSKAEIVVMNAGAPPPMERIDRIGWDAFTANWNTDTRATLTWVQAALTMPIAPGGLVLLVSSGAAVQGSPLSGGYAGAKRAQWFIASYAQALSDQLGLGLRFRVVVPRQMFVGTGVGDTGISAYAAASGKSFDEQAAGWPQMTPRGFGDTVAELIAGTGFDEGRVWAVRGDTGATLLE